MWGEEGIGRQWLEQGMGLVLNLMLGAKGMTEPSYWVFKTKQD